jgi:RNA polymerase sigma-70 factor (ECF subfamily)
VPEARIAVGPKVPERIKIPPELLSPRQAVVLDMLYRRDMDVAEVAQVLAIDRQTVRSTHHKAMIKLRAHFQAELI